MEKQTEATRLRRLRSKIKGMRSVRENKKLMADGLPKGSVFTSHYIVSRALLRNTFKLLRKEELKKVMGTLKAAHIPRKERRKIAKGVEIKKAHRKPIFPWGEFVEKMHKAGTVNEKISTTKK